MSTAEIVKELEAQNYYSDITVLKDGTICAVGELMFTRALYIGLDMYGWEKRFCFDDRERANVELRKLQTADDEPTGYIARRNG